MTKKTTIKENFEGLLETIKSAGINLSESQLASLSKFKDAMEAKVSEAERITEARITKEYRQVFESLLDNLMEHERLTSRVQAIKEAKRTEATQKEKMADKLDSYLNECLEEMITEKSAVDYDKMRKYETLVESMKGLVLENSDEVGKFKLSPFAPHISEELWHLMGHEESVTDARFPEYVAAYTVEDNVTYPVQFNGKMRFTVDLPKSAAPAEVEASVRALEQTARWVGEGQIVKVVVVPGRIINIVVK